MSEKWNTIVHNYLVIDRDISELESNGGTSLFARKHGKRVEIKNVFDSEEEYEREIINLIKLVKPDFIGEPKFLEEGKLKLIDGNTARVHIVLPPVSDYPQITIAKKTTSLTTLENIYNAGSLSTKMKNFLIAAVDCKLNIVFSGSTGSGKTTMMEAITKLIPSETRIGVVEDSPELSLAQPNVTYLHTSPWKPGMDPNEEVSLDWCVKQINRMRTDLLLIGETRGKEFAEFLTASNSGMEGSMTTLHANSPRLALSKMTQFVMLAQTQPVRVINKNIANTIDVIVQLTKTPQGEYKCIEIAEISRMLGQDESAEIATTNLSEYNKDTRKWSDSFLISDALRKKFQTKGYDCNSFTKSGVSFRTKINNMQTQKPPSSPMMPRLKR